MEQRQFFLRDILTVIFKHKVLITMLPLLVFGAVFLGNYVWPPTYESEARVQLVRGRETSQVDPTVTAGSQQLTMVQMGIEDINSEIQLLHSRDLLGAVVEELDLVNEPRFPYGSGPIRSIYSTGKKAIRGVLSIVGLVSVGDAKQQAMKTLDDRIITEPVRDSFVLQVGVRMGDAELAQTILDEVLDEYMKLHVAVFRNTESLPFFEEQLARVEKDLANAQSKLQEFRKQNSISLLDTEKELLLSQYAEAQRILSQLEESAKVISSDDLDSSLISSLSSETESTVVREMQLRLLELLLEQNRVAQSLGPKHPTVLSLREQVADAQASLVEAIATTRRLTEKKLSTVQTRLDSLNDTKAELEQLQQRVDILSDNYELYSKKVEESRIADELAERSISNVRIVSSPSMPVSPILPNKLLNLVLGLVGGLVAALALAFFFDYLDHGLKTPEDVDHYLKIPPMASFFNKQGQPLDAREAERLAVMLESRVAGNDGHVVEVASSVPREGSEAVANAVADAYGNDPESRTLLIDFAGDAGRLTSGQGLSDVLLGQADLDSVFTTEDALTVVGRGAQAEYPAYLWGTDRMQELVDQLRLRYKNIIFSVGPVLQSQDAIKLARHVDSIVITIKSDATRREVVGRAISMLGASREKIAGAVLTERTQVIPNAVYRRI